MPRTAPTELKGDPIVIGGYVENMDGPRGWMYGVVRECLPSGGVLVACDDGKLHAIGPCHLSGAYEDDIKFVDRVDGTNSWDTLLEMNQQQS